ncbi:hypothetical protein [Deinococcus fonticola]|uniref:hypothetical protein n=1 Tax=Deinococcus fonticola TaxID=2528713 RepID=UPI00107504FA|nr:hypothetical protein [Deinococcus fonticola]
MSDGDTYKYDYPEKLPLTLKQKLSRLFTVILLVLAWGWFFRYGLPAFGELGGIPVALMTIILPAATFSRKKKIELFPRYLICGPNIVYFQNVEALTLKDQAGTLTIDYLQGKLKKQFVLDRKNFPTNARKQHKIDANRQKKFDKVVARITRAVGQQAPQVALPVLPLPADAPVAVQA